MYDDTHRRYGDGNINQPHRHSKHHHHHHKHHHHKHHSKQAVVPTSLGKDAGIRGHKSENRDHGLVEGPMDEAVDTSNATVTHSPTDTTRENALDDDGHLLPAGYLEIMQFDDEGDEPMPLEFLASDVDHSCEVPKASAQFMLKEPPTQLETSNQDHSSTFTDIPDTTRLNAPDIEGHLPMKCPEILPCDDEPMPLEYLAYTFDHNSQVPKSSELMMQKEPPSQLQTSNQELHSPTFTNSPDTSRVNALDVHEHITLECPELIQRDDEPMPLEFDRNTESMQKEQEPPSRLQLGTPNQEHAPELLATSPTLSSMRPTSQIDEEPSAPAPFYEVEARLVQDPEAPTVYDGIPVTAVHRHRTPSFWERYKPAVLVGVILLVIFLVTILVLFLVILKEDTTTTSTSTSSTLPPPETAILTSTLASTGTDPFTSMTTAVSTAAITTETAPETNTSVVAATTTPSTTLTPSIASIATTDATEDHATTTSSTTKAYTRIIPATSTTTATESTTTFATTTFATTTPAIPTTTTSEPATTTTLTTPSTTSITTTTTSTTAATTTPDSCTQLEVTLLGQTDNAVDCKDGCPNVVAIDGDVAMVTRDNVEIQFLSSNSQGIFEESTTIEFEYSINAGRISSVTDVAAVGYMETRYARTKTGGVYIYEKDFTGKWVKSTHISPGDLNIVPSTGPFGVTLDIYEPWIVIGVPNNGQSGYRGSVYIYRHSKDSWVQEANLTPLNIDRNVEAFGSSVSIKGNLVAVGDMYYGDHDEGAIWHYEYNALSKKWEEKNIIINEDCDGWFSADLKLTEDGNLLAGCPGADNQAGSVYYYTKSDSGQYKTWRKITASTGSPMDTMGIRLAVDDDIMLAGTLLKESGKVHVFKRAKSDMWMESITINAPKGAGYFGTKIDLSGNMVIVGSDGNAHFYSLECPAK